MVRPSMALWRAEKKGGCLADCRSNCVPRPTAFNRCGEWTSQNQREEPAHWGSRRLEQTALVPHSPLGWAEISHPFHPLRGRQFEVLKKRRVAGVDMLILRELERG